MNFDWTTFALQLANVLILLAILRRFLFRPVAGIIARRQAETDAALSAAAQAQEDAAGAAEAARAETEATRAVRQEILAKAQAEAETIRAAMLDKARAEAAAVVAKGRDQAARDREADKAAALAQARDLAGAIAARALSGMPRPPDGTGYGTRLAAALDALAPAERAAIQAGGHLRVVAPEPLTEPEARSLSDALQPFGIAPEVEIDPDLIAGLELRSDSGVVRNSLAHDLDTIAKALANDSAT
jgi:F-type H+-transporting ATPase subunit b